VGSGSDGGDTGGTEVGSVTDSVDTGMAAGSGLARGDFVTDAGLAAGRRTTGL
jgi:hypothetical protein